MLCMGLIKWNLIQLRKSLHIYKSKVSFIMLPFYKTTCFDQYRIGRRDDTSVYLVGVFFNMKQMWGKVHYEFSLLWCYTAWCSDKEPRKFSNALVQAGIIYFYTMSCDAHTLLQKMHYDMQYFTGIACMVKYKLSF